MSKPNVIFVLTDDQGYGDLSCHGNPVIKTPYLDVLREESVRFTDFHVSPMCTPTRGELMTGQDALRNGATFVCMGRSLINPELPTIADIFGNNGYRTGHFGKWHLGDNYPYRPQDRGFQETIHHPAWGITSAADYFGNDYFDDTYRHNGEYEAFEGYCTDVWFDEAMKWIERSDDGPFFAYIATNAPHTPLWVPDKYRQPYLEQVDYPVA
ncbi:MAG: sulfatase-like hydrolase/transferase, partial [Gemmatimonadota bacterium]|nr:sulfatase-like hydrolase/transferase [Gemmatimonadota bacterium]